jgi:cytochrome c-type biogenesis protein CcmH
MSLFVFFAAVLALLAVAFAISALWQRSRGLAFALALGLPLVAGALYYFKGEPAALDQKNVVAAAPTTMEEAVETLQKRVAADPNDFEATAMLARAYMAVENFELARDTYAKALKLNPDDSDLSVEYAEALLRTSADRRFPPEAVQMLENAVARNPANQRALFFLGVHQIHDNRPADAAATWEKLLPLLNTETAATLRPQIAAAREAAGLPPLPEAASLATLNIDVEIDPTLADLAKPGDVLFVFARAIDGGGPPLAAKRIELGTLPLSVKLTDADSPMPAAKLSSQKDVVVVARLSKSGDVMPASGDVESDPVAVSTTGTGRVTLVLNRTRP